MLETAPSTSPNAGRYADKEAQYDTPDWLNQPVLAA
jgi:hypothetical protein